MSIETPAMLSMSVGCRTLKFAELILMHGTACGQLSVSLISGSMTQTPGGSLCAKSSLFTEKWKSATGPVWLGVKHEALDLEVPGLATREGDEHVICRILDVLAGERRRNEIRELVLAAELGNCVDVDFVMRQIIS
jgi:hypothetical protein